MASSCKICSHPEGPRFILGARQGGKDGKGWNAAEAAEAAAVFGLTFSRPTWYEHQKHARTGTQLMISAAEKVRREGALTVADIRKSSNTELLEAIRDLGMARALNNPDEVTVDQAIKAVQVMEGRKEKGSDSLNVLVQFITGQPPTYVIEGEAREVPEGAATA